VTFVGGSRSGTHHGVGDLGCVAYDGFWQAAWEERTATGLSGFLLHLQGVPASGGRSTNVTFTAVLGSQVEADAAPVLVDVLGSEHGGDGQASVTRDGASATIRLEGSSPQGSWVVAVLRCSSVEGLR
jgi:hypothetical protein